LDSRTEAESHLDKYVLDACVLYPVVLRDLLLTLAVESAFEPIWSEEILDEMRRNVLADRPDITPEQFDRATTAGMETHFPAATISGYEHLIKQMDNDVKDRHVAAVAVHASASVIVTYNLRDFVSKELERRRIVILHPAAVVETLLDTEPNPLERAIVGMSRRRRNPPMSPEEVVHAICRQQSFAHLVDRLNELVA
jgi:predicted nucleic acid-binding protein